MKTITKAVIPVGGEGSRMFPISNAFPKEFVPLKDSFGNIKPAIMYLLEELDSAGIKEIYIMVTKKWQNDFYEHFFFEDLSDFCKDKLTAWQMKYFRKIKKISKKIKIYFNKDIHGFGHVLYHCNNFIKDEPFLLLLGDQIYRSNTNCSCIKQILDNYDGNLTIAASKVPLDDVNKYGIMSGKFVTSNSFIISDIKEKPTKLYAKKYLKMPYENSDTYFSVFGTYILNKKILLDAKRFFDSKKKLDSEYQLTPFLENYKDKKIAFIPDGKYFDIGNFESYNESYILFQMDSKERQLN